MKKTIRPAMLGLFLVALIGPLQAQVNDTPAANYQWKKNKSELLDGYVVLKSGKRMDGKISLRGSADKVTSIIYVENGQNLTFPPGSLKSYGLTGVSGSAPSSERVSAAAGPVSDSPESMYEWKSMGIVMNKEIHATTPRPGYIVLKNGTRYEGELKLKKKAGIMDDFEIKTADGKEKIDPSDVARYGYTVSQAQVDQENLSKEVGKSLQGTITTASGTEQGEIDIQAIGKPYVERIIFRQRDGKLVSHTTQTIKGFSVTDKKGIQTKYIIVDDVFVEEGYNGSTFQFYLNPKPTTINESATNWAKAAVDVGTTAAASEIAKADQRRNNYTSNIDSVISVSTTEQLIEMRTKLAALGGYSSHEEAMEKSDNESLKANIGALNVAIAGREITESEGGIMNKEWIIFNKKTGEKTIVWRGDYEDQIVVLLMGCEKYLMLSKSEQKDLTKWNNTEQTLKFLDGCY